MFSHTDADANVTLPRACEDGHVWSLDAATCQGHKAAGPSFVAGGPGMGRPLWRTEPGVRRMRRLLGVYAEQLSTHISTDACAQTSTAASQPPDPKRDQDTLSSWRDKVMSTQKTARY